MSKIKPLKLHPPQLTAQFFDEPKLLFADRGEHSNPKIGIALYGPQSLGTSRHKQEVHIGFIGTGEGMAAAKQFYGDLADGVEGETSQISFPGCKSDRGFRCELRMDENLFEPITRKETVEILGIKKQQERFKRLLELLKIKLELLTQRDYPLDYIVFVPPHDIFQKCRVANYRVQKIPIHRDLRRAFKALAMQFHKPTQILRETTIGLVNSQQQLDHRSCIAWNLFTGLYFKVEGLPWSPVGLTPGTCFIGISFFRSLGSVSTLRSSVVQAFDENGEGLVLRGPSFHWDSNKEGRSPHLPEDMAHELLQMVLARYRNERRHLPRRVVVHKSSRFEPEERSGFEKVLCSSGVEQYDLVSLRMSNDVRLIRAGQYPPLRGASFNVGDISYLYTTGYIPELGGYPHGHVPSPLQVADHIGDTSDAQIKQEILLLTKMNFNSADFAGSLPIDLRFSRLVGDILREIPTEQRPEPKYKYYM
ncbi:hypothetical protein IQ235_02880 [Oscillatoriales cyanobacterium LEGE 11467]|uniref:Piwi domain-containing protein n=1 Tax=Zarconia navalis LEGE 11467 TaxID=1828826 RepID=A0A928VWV7_9CYAN|nr:hypothetical protein [Zarconia navalis]MBE9039736.1 hypothetical protein [Zarconia navalis LEGE 11467]